MQRNVLKIEQFVSALQTAHVRDHEIIADIKIAAVLQPALFLTLELKLRSAVEN